MWDHGGVEGDAVTHDLAKFCTLLLRRNGYVLEQVMSPLVVATSEVHAELTALVPQLVTSNHAHHYLGFAPDAERRSGELPEFPGGRRALHDLVVRARLG